MYSTSQQYISPGRPQYSGLESLTQSAPMMYSMRSFNADYDAKMFIPVPESISTFSYDHSVLSNIYKTFSETSYLMSSPRAEYHFSPEPFLKPGKEGFFVGKAEEIKEFIRETFENMFDIPFPSDIKISVLSSKEFRKIAPSTSTIGLSINRRKHGLLSEIFILNDSLARVMLTLGHELGHVLTETLQNSHDEEAKAYAFSLAWMKCIKEHDIAGLADAIVVENPAHNGLHDVAFAFVQKLIRKGEKVWDIYKSLILQELSVAA